MLYEKPRSIISSFLHLRFKYRSPYNKNLLPQVLPEFLSAHYLSKPNLQRGGHWNYLDSCRILLKVVGHAISMFTSQGQFVALLLPTRDIWHLATTANIFGHTTWELGATGTQWAGAGDAAKHTLMDRMVFAPPAKKHPFPTLNSAESENPYTFSLHFPFTF